MKRKKGISTLILFIAGAIFMSVTILTAEEIKTPEEVIIENGGYKRDTKPAVHLSHLKHSTQYGAACTDCHHNYKDGKNAWKEEDPVKKCIECHDPNKNQGDVKKLQTSFHNNCKGCHREKDPSSEKAPSKRCTDCHKG